MKKICKFGLLLFGMFFVIPDMGYSQRNNSQDSDHQRHISFNPLNPKIISYEQGGNINIELITEDKNKTLYTVNCGNQEQDFGDFSNQLSENREAYSPCSHLDWRPVYDINGNFWFSFIDNRSNSLNLGFIDGSLNCSVTGDCGTFEITSDELQPGNVLSRPKWSPDGQNIALQNANEIWMIYDIQSLLKKEKTTIASAKKLVDGSFFEWSPDQKYIAFETLNNGLSDIGILDMRSITQSRSLDISYVRNLLNTDRDKYKPSWSSDGNLLAYQVEGYTEGAWAVKLLKISEIRGDVEVREVTEGRNYEIEDYYKSNDERSGPVIVNFVRVTYPQDSTEYSFLVYVSADQNEQRPIKVHSVDPRFNVPQNKIRRSANNDFVAAYTINDSLKIAYSSQRDYAMRLTFDEIDFSSQFRTPKNYQPKEISDRRAVKLSSYMPGLGQIYKGDVNKGIAFSAATVGLGGYLGYNIIKGKSNRVMNVTSGLLAGVYAFNVLESTSGFTKDTYFYSSALIHGLGQLRRGEILKGSLLSVGTLGLATFIGVNSYHNPAYSVVNISASLLLAGTYAYNIYDSVTGLPKVIGIDPDIVQINFGTEQINLKSGTKQIPVFRFSF